MSQHHLVVVPHTHWDREWYRTYEEFRFRLVRLLDGLLHLLETDPAFRHFTLDGQTIVLDDYLEVRPEARERIAALVREGRLRVGPWYVLPDEWLVSGEALIRNLRLGLSEAAAFGGAMGVGYVPDQFGHVGQLPQIFAGFGLAGAILWRGVGGDVDRTAFLWEAPDGTGIFSVYLIRGYGNAVHLPLEARALAQRLEAEVQALAPHSPTPSLLLMNGSDHVEPQPGLPAALEAALGELDGVSGEIGTLDGFVARARGEAPDGLPSHRGELRSGLRAPLLAGCASSRAQQKRADFLNDRLLTRYLEPMAAWLEALGGDGDPEMIDFTWRLALQNHPHDSICGCSVDGVHDEMEARFARVADLGAAQLERVTEELAEHLASPPDGADGAGGEAIVAWNPCPGGTAQAEGLLELDLPGGSRRSPALHLRDGGGRRIAVHAEIVEPGQTAVRLVMNAEGATAVIRGFPPEFMGLFPRRLGWRREGGRLSVDVVLGSRPARDFDFAAAKEVFVRELGRSAVEEVDFGARQLARVRLRFVDDLPGCGLRVYRLARGGAHSPSDAPALIAERLPDGGAAIENEVWRVEAAPDGSVCCRHRPSGTEIRDALRLVSEGDRGDTYTFDPVPGAEVVERPRRARVALLPSSRAEVGIAIAADYRVPAELVRDRTRRTSRRVGLSARIALRLAAGLDRIDVEIEAENRARDHRLRAHLRAPLAATVFEVESAFEVVERPIAPEPSAFGSDRPAEFPSGATPQRSFATVHDGKRALTVANRGSSEVEAVRETDGTTSLAVTLLRAVGWLSREDLHLRPVHAGPPEPTPGAQVPGPHRAELSLRLHPVSDATRTAEAHRFAAPALAFAGSATSGGALSDGARLVEVDDPGVVVSAIEPRRWGAPLIRLLNASTGERRVHVRWNGPGARTLEALTLSGSSDPAVRLEPGQAASARVALRPWQILSLRPR